MTTAAPIKVRERVVAYAIDHPTASSSEVAAATGANPSTTATYLSTWRRGEYPDLPSPPGTEWIECDVRCTCSNRQTESLPGDAPARRALASIKCRSCGRVGTSKLVPPLAHAASIDPDDVA